MEHYLKLLVIGLSLWLAIMSSLLHIELWVKRIVLAIREQDVEYKNCFKRLAFFWVLVAISFLI